MNVTVLNDSHSMAMLVCIAIVPSLQAVPATNRTSGPKLRRSLNAEETRRSANILKPFHAHWPRRQQSATWLMSPDHQWLILHFHYISWNGLRSALMRAKLVKKRYHPVVDCLLSSATIGMEHVWSRSLHMVRGTLRPRT